MIIAISMVRDESDILPITLSCMSSQVDQIICLDNNSTDNSSFWIRIYGDVIHDSVMEYEQSAKMTALARLACAIGAEWIVPFDADEYWVGIRKSIEHAGQNNIIRFSSFPVYGNNGQLHVSPREDMGKVIMRADPSMVINVGNHSGFYSYPGMDSREVLTTHGHIRHYQYRSQEQYVSKLSHGAKAISASSNDGNIGTHWRAAALKNEQDLINEWNLKEQEMLSWPVS